jgi:hypothetical protein
MHTYQSLVNEALETVAEIFPWDLEDSMGKDETPLIVDIREPAKFTMAHIEDSLHVPRGQLEGACEWNYLKTGIKGWNDSDLPLVDAQDDIVDADELDEILSKPLPLEKLASEGVAPTPIFLRR